MNSNIIEKLHFINISTDEVSIFDWKPPGIFKSNVLDLNIVKENMATDIFFHIYKGNEKIVHIRKDNLLYTIGASQEVQFQILEALLEKVHEEFHEIYDIKVIFSYEDVSASIFKKFAKDVDEIVSKINDLDLIQKVDVYCTVCQNTLPLFIKKSIMKSATSFPVPIVYNHKGHAIVCYIDQNFIVRGVELVNTTG